MAEKASEKARLLAASTVLKKHFSRLLDIPPEEICDYLYEDHVITMDGLEKATNKLFTNRDRTRTMMMSLQKAVNRSCSHFERFCDYLISENPALGYSEIAQSMKDSYFSSIQQTHEGCSVKVYPIEVSQPLAATTTNTTTNTSAATTAAVTTTAATTAAVTTTAATTAAVAPIQPDILWICASNKVYQLAKDEGHVSTLQVARMTSDKHFEYLELELPPDMRVIYHAHGNHLKSPIVWLMHPTHRDHLKPASVCSLLQYFNTVRFFILNTEIETSSVSQSIGQSNSSGGIYVPKTLRNGSGFIAELRHMTALWQLRRNQDNSDCSWLCGKSDADERSVVRFCTLDQINSSEVTSFYTAADEVWRKGIKNFHAAVLSDNSEECCNFCRGHHALHSVQYSYRVVQYLCHNLLWSYKTSSL